MAHPLTSIEPLLPVIRQRPLGLMSDIDGTLSPIVSRPEEATVPEATRTLLRQLMTKGVKVGLITGRSLETARRMAGLDDVAYAAEHLEIQTRDAREVALRVRNAGAIFVGAWSPVSLGDYAAGSNHVLPTGGWARARGGLSVGDFVKCLSVQRISRAGFRRLAPVAKVLAQAENLAAHARAVEVRE